MLITGGFWMAFCVVTAYAAVYLQGVGCTNGELGLILALGNVGGALLSPVLGARIDRNRSLRRNLYLNLNRNPLYLRILNLCSRILPKSLFLTQSPKKSSWCSRRKRINRMRRFS